MAVSNPQVLEPGQAPPEGAVSQETWFERSLGEFTHQTKLSGFYVATSGQWFVTARDWYLWDEEIVQYHIKHGHNAPEINAFIQAHALGGR